MKEFWNTIQLIFTATGGWLGYFLGGCDGLLYALIAFVVVDYVTGVMCAVADKKLSSEVGFKGICRKVLIFLLVGIANILDVQVIGTGSVLRTAVIFFMTGQRMKRGMSDHETGAVIPDEKSLLYGGEENHGKGADAPFRGMPAATGICIYQQLEQGGLYKRLRAWLH